MSKKNELSIKIGTKSEALWTEVKNAAESRIENLEKNLIIEKEILKLAQNKILLEKRK